MMSIESLLEMMTPEVYNRLKTAVELGKWPDGTALTQEQVASCLQAVILYESNHLQADQRTGYVPPKPACASDTPKTAQDLDQVIKWSE